MKQQIIELKKKLLLVELPEDTIQIGYSMFDNKGNCYLEYYTNDKRCIKTRIVLNMDSKNYKLTDITESQCEQWVEAYTSLENKFRNYTTPAYIEFLMKTAKESFFSYLERQGILFSNPLGEFPTKQNTGLEYGMEYISKVQNWEEAESKVWDINKCWIFEIL